MKIGLFAVIVYTISIFVGMMFGNFLGRFSDFLKTVTVALFLLLGSTYIQILKIHVASTSETSLRAAMRETKEAISKGFLRILMGNISVSLVAFAGTGSSLCKQMLYFHKFVMFYDPKNYYCKTIATYQEDMQQERPSYLDKRIQVDTQNQPEKRL